MPRIPFIEAALGLPDQSADLIEARLRNFHRKLLAAAALKNSAETDPFDNPLGYDRGPDSSLRKILTNDRRVNGCGSGGSEDDHDRVSPRKYLKADRTALGLQSKTRGVGV